jgi:outer membrane cobalamin receptor
MLNVSAIYLIKRNFYTLLLLVLLFTCTHHAFAQYTITGSITDEKTSEALIGVVVHINNKPLAVSDNKGSFTITVNDTGAYFLKYTYIGYTDFTQMVVVTSSQTVLAIKLQPSDKLLNQVVVSAGRYEQDVKRLAVSTEVIQPYLIQNKATTNMEKLMDQIPSVNVVDGQINIRGGSGWTYGAGSRVLVLVDDMPILTGDAGQVPWKFVPTENIQQVEVIKGAASVLYGSSALNGIVNIRTAAPSAKPSTTYSPFYGLYQFSSNSTYTPVSKMQSGFNLSHSQKIKQLDLSMGLNLFHDDGYRLGENEDRVRFSFNTTYHSKKIAHLTYGINGSIIKQYSTSFLLWQSFEDRYTILNNDKTFTNALNFSIDPHVDFYAFGMKHRIHNRILRIKNDNSGGTNSNQSNASTLLYGDYQLQKNIGLFVLTGGLNSTYTESNSPLYGGLNSAGNVAPFFQADMKWKRLNATAGIRHENFQMNGRYDHRLIKRIGVNIEITKYTFFRTSYGEGYRYPSIAERYISTSVGSVNIFPNPNLTPETGWNAEAGIKQGFKLGQWQGFADIAYFRTEYDNMVEFNFGQWTPFDLNNPFASIGFKSFNIGKTRIDGWDYSLTTGGTIGKVDLKILAGFTSINPVSLEPDKVFASDSATPAKPYTYKNTSSDTSSNVLKYRYNQLAKVDIQATYKIISIGVSMRYNSYMQNIDNVFITLPFTLFVSGIDKGRALNKQGDFIWDTRFGVDINKHVKVNLVINNVFNHEMMSRPADMCPPRLILLQFTFKI